MNPSSLANPTVCTLCGGVSRRVYEGMSGYVEGTRYDVYECSACLSSHVDPMSNLEEEYDIIYGKDNKEDAVYKYYYYLAEGVKHIRNPLKALFSYTAIYWGVKEAFRSISLPSQASVLEVGSGLGYFTYALHAAGYRAHGVEYSSTATAFAKNYFGDLYTQGTIEEYAKMHPSSYDVIVATEVIEHVVDPVSFISACALALKPGGRIIITTPNKDVHPQGTIWETDHAPKHLWWFSKQGISEIAKRAGATCDFVDFTDYKKQNRYTLPVGIAGASPDKAPVVDSLGGALHKEQIGYKVKLMRTIPAWAYIYLVGLYHKCALSRSTPENGDMYSICAIITK